MPSPEEIDVAAYGVVERLEGKKGARWDDILRASAVGGLTAEDVEEALNRLMDKGYIYEPTLGILKTCGVRPEQPSPPPVDPPCVHGVSWRRQCLQCTPGQRPLVYHGSSQHYADTPCSQCPAPSDAEALAELQVEEANAPPALVLTEEQEAAKQSMVEVLLGPRGGRLVVGGLAGTGKTVLIKHVLDECRRREVSTVATVAFTGKAANVLRQKGISDARTIHSTIYHVHEDEETGKITFSRRGVLEDVTAFIVDESSMLNKRLYEDLLSYRLPIVFVGDHGQLEPVGDDPGVMRRPDILLETIHRQAAGSPIIQFAHALRNGQRIDWDAYDPVAVQHLKPDEADNWLLDFDMIICGFNATRNEVNSKVRKLQGRKSPLEVGDTLNCLRNDSELGVFNGMMFTVEAIHSKVIKTIGFMSGEMGMVWTVNLRTDGGALLEEVPLVLRQDREFQGVSYGHIIADYGYALTCHRAQGSQADNVLVFEEVHRDGDRKRWTYTAATRAAKTLAWVR